MAQISGRVVDYSTNAPLPNVMVQGVAQNGTIFTTVFTDSEGKYDTNHTGFDDLYSTITFQKEGYKTQSMRPASANGVDVPLPQNGTLAAVTLTLKQNPAKAFLYVLIGAGLVYLFIKYRKRIKM